MEDTAKKIVDAILLDLNDRRGIRQAFDEIDSDILDDIRADLIVVVERIIRESR